MKRPRTIHPKAVRENVRAKIDGADEARLAEMENLSKIVRSKNLQLNRQRSRLEFELGRRHRRTTELDRRITAGSNALKEIGEETERVRKLRKIIAKRGSNGKD